MMRELLVRANFALTYTFTPQKQHFFDENFTLLKTESGYL